MTAAHVEQLARLIFNAVGGIDDHHDTVGGDEGPIGVLAEIVVPGRVDERHATALQLEFESSRRNGDAALLLELHPVRRGMATGVTSPDGPREFDSAGVEQKLFCQRGLARVGVRDDREGAPPGNLALEFGQKRGRVGLLWLFRDGL